MAIERVPEATPAAKWSDEQLQKLAEAIVFHRSGLAFAPARSINNVIPFPKKIEHQGARA